MCASAHERVVLSVGGHPKDGAVRGASTRSTLMYHTSPDRALSWLPAPPMSASSPAGAHAAMDSASTLGRDSRCSVAFCTAELAARIRVVERARERERHERGARES